MEPAAAPAPAPAPSRRSARNTNRLSIFDEDLLYEMYNESLGLDVGGGKGTAGKKRQGADSLQPSSRRTEVTRLPGA